MPGQDAVSGVQVLVDSAATSPGMLVQSGNRGRGRGGRGGRGRGGGRGRRSTSGPPPEIDHNIEVQCSLETLCVMLPSHIYFFSRFFPNACLLLFGNLFSVKLLTLVVLI